LRDYEAVIILDPRLDEASSKEAIERFTKIVAAKGEMTKMDVWGRRRLAYEIGHLSEGNYLVAKFKAEDPKLLEELDRLFKIGEEYIRAKIVRIS
jgi:small subunit ribosomal protein S6